jgi:hypothetical protein
LAQIEQLHSVASMAAGAVTSKRTKPQWHPPLCLTWTVSDTYAPPWPRASARSLAEFLQTLIGNQAAASISFL